MDISNFIHKKEKKMPSQEVRTYQMLVSPSFDDPCYKKLEENHIVHNKSIYVFMDTYASIIGSYQPNFNLAKPFAKDIEDKKAAKQEIGTKEIFAFCCWFRLESDSDCPFVIDQKDIFPRFLEYWGNNNFNHEVVRQLTELKTSEADGCHRWVDRRQAFLELNKTLKMSQEDSRNFFEDKKLPLANKGDNANVWVRDRFSNMWGRGQKTSDECLKSHLVLLSLDYEKLSKYDNINDVLTIMAETLKVKPNYPAIRSKLREGTTGKNPSHIIRLDKYVNKNDNTALVEFEEKLKEWIDKETKRKEEDLSNRPWTKNLLNYLENKLDQKYHQEKGCLLRWWSGFSMPAIGLIRKHHSEMTHALHRVNVEKSKIQKAQSSKDFEKFQPIIKQFCEDQDNENYTFRINQTNELDNFINIVRELNKNKKNLHEAVSIVHDEHGKRISTGFFTWLIENHLDLLLSKIKPSEINKGFKNIGTFQEAQQKLDRLHMPRLRFPSEKRPQYFRTACGDNLPKNDPIFVPIESHFKYLEDRENPKSGVGKALDEDHKVLGKFEVELINLKGEIEFVEIPVMSKRIIREVAYRLGNKGNINHIRRNENLSRRQRKIKQKELVESYSSPNFSAMFYKKNGTWNKSGQNRWYIDVSVKWESEKPNLTNLKIGDKILGIDWGIRNWASWAIVEVVSPNTPNSIPIQFKNDDVLCHVLPIKSDKLVNVNPETGIDVLNFFQEIEKRDLVHAQNILTRLMKISNPANEKEKSDFIWHGKSKSIYNLLLFILRKIKSTMRKRENETPLLVTYKKELLLLLEEWKDWFFSVKGALSNDRLSLMNDYQSCFKMVSKILEDNDKKTSETFKEKADELRKKINKKKKERIRLVANSILTLAVDNNCCMIVSENLNIKSDKKSNRFMNRQRNQWGPQETTEQLKDQCKFNGVYLKLINPYNSSHKDFSDNDKWKPRLYNVSVKELKEESWKNYFKRMYSRYNSLKDKIKGGYAQAVVETVKALGCDHWKDLYNLPQDQQLLIPKSGGLFYKCKAFQNPISADQSAAYFMASKGAAMNLYYKKLP